VSADPHQATIRVQALGGTWETLGADRYRSIVPEGLVCSANRWGSDTCGFTLRRDVSPLGPDLSTWTPVEIEIAGVVVWDGRIRATPTSESDGPVISVQGQGWQYHLDDDLYDRVYAQTRLSDWQDYRNFPTAYLPESPLAGTVSAGSGRIVLGWANGAVVAGSTGIAVTLDLGPGSIGAKRIVVTGDFTGLGGFFGFYARGHSALNSAGSFAFTGASDAIANMPSTATTYAGTFSSNFRYVTLICWYPGATTTTGVERSMSLTSVQVFTDTAYESGNASVLKIDQVAKDALSQATLLLSTDTSNITAGTTSLPEFSVTDSTPRQAISGANAYENYETKMLIGRRLAVRPRPSVPAYEIGAWSGAQFQDASAGSGDDIVNRFIVRGTGPDGSQIRVDRRSSDIGVTTLADRRGFLHTRTTSAGAAITTTVGQRIADLYLTAYSTSPFAGSFQAVPGGVRRADNGSEPHPAWLLRDTGQLVRCTDRVDPDTGAWGRSGEIDTVTYTHDTLTADVALNENRAGLEALLARYAVVVGQRA
jgi:hypothetical protein